MQWRGHTIQRDGMCKGPVVAAQLICLKDIKETSVK
jgi:hypothetical protein